MIFLKSFIKRKWKKWEYSLKNTTKTLDYKKYHPLNGNDSFLPMSEIYQNLKYHIFMKVFHKRNLMDHC